MKIFEQEKVSERFAKLPNEVQGIIISDTTSDTIGKIMESVGLEGEKKQECIQQITLVSVGLATASDFREYVQKELTLSSEQATLLEQQVTKDIFAPIKRSLLNTLQNNSTESSETIPTDGTMESSGGTHDPYRELKK